MSDITRVEKLLRASIDGVPCSLKPLTRVEKLLVELNEAIAGPAPTVILPETEMTKIDLMWSTASMPENRPEIGKKYNVTCNAEIYTWECLSPEEAGMSAEHFESVIALISESSPFCVMFPTPAVAEAEGCGVMVQGIADTWQPESVTLSIVEAVEESGSAGGGRFVVKADCDLPTQDDAVQVTPDKSYDEVKAAYDAGKTVVAELNGTVGDDMAGTFILQLVGIVYEGSTFLFETIFQKTEIMFFISPGASAANFTTVA